MRILFMGTPDFAAVSLKRLVEDGHELCGVFTQPDKPRDRGMKPAFSPVKELALERGIEVYQPASMRAPEAAEALRALAPDVLAVVAYGKILPDEVLAIPRLGSVNVHGSLLPKYRMSRRQNVSFCGSSAVFHTFLTTMREPSICVTRIFVPFSMKSPSLTTFSRTPSNSPSPVGLSAVVAVPSRPRNTCMSSAER